MIIKNVFFLSLLLSLSFEFTQAGLLHKDLGNQSSDLYKSDKKINQKELQFRQAMRDLWADHGIWTHEYIVATLSNIPNSELIAKRLLANQDEIGKAIVPYYGKEAGDKLAKLLREHILVAADLIGAAKSGNQAKLQEADQKWHQNAKEIATFLSKANSYWPVKEMVGMLNLHLALTADQALARLNKKWERDIELYDDIRKQLAQMADSLSEGIIKQFPQKFS